VKKLLVLLMLPILAACVLIAGCGDNVENNSQAEGAAPAPDMQAAAPAAMPADPNAWHGKVVETMDASNYTYVLLDTGSERLWCAGPQTPIKVGDEVSIPKGMLMTGFHSKALDRDFAEIYFVGAINPAAGGMPAGMPHGGMGDTGDMGGMGAAPAGEGPVSGTQTVLDDAHVEGVKKATDGYTVAEIYAKGADLNAQQVKVRGRVVKFTPAIMGTNWVHIQDGTGSGDTVDLTVTTNATVGTGDVVLVDGTLATNKDFGAGYFYKAIIEDATVIKE